MKKKIYETCEHMKFVCDGCKTIKAMVKSLRSSADTLEKMAADGVKLETEVDGGHAMFTTADPKIAKKYKMEELLDMEDE